ncbi:MAG: hypothetical protein M5R36_05275 [Deltaproteobacteria bacterium]|nr:hypothetical protein [Deltaproteobacteria bacterium]
MFQVIRHERMMMRFTGGRKAPIDGRGSRDDAVRDGGAIRTVRGP